MLLHKSKKTLNPGANIITVHTNSGLLQICTTNTPDKDVPSSCWTLGSYLVVSLLCGAGGQLVDVILCCGQVSRKIPNLHCAVQTAGHYKRGFHPDRTHTQGKVYLSAGLEDVALAYWTTSYDTWSRRRRPQHWCGCSPGPHSAHCHRPCATHRPTCPASTDATHLFDPSIEHMLTHGAQTGSHTSKSPFFPHSLL